MSQEEESLAYPIYLERASFSTLPYNIWRIVNMANKNFAALKKPALEAAS